jgi:NADH-quinone oxidoreductase subunit M
VEAPTAGSVILAGVLLKMGAYGFLRFSVPMLPLAAQHFAPLMFALGVVAVIYTSLVALAQEDMKKLIAYSSVAHMGVVVIGIFTFNVQGIDGALFQMLSHGIVSAALFLCVGVVYDRIHTRDIARYGGLGDRMPFYAFVFMLFTMGSIGLPGTSGFVGEFLVLVGAFQVNIWLALLGSFGMVLGAAYMLYLYRRIIFGKITKPDLRAILDLSPREIAIFAPLVILTLWLGIYPSSFTGFFDSTVGALVQSHQQALNAAHHATMLAAGAAR